MIFVIKVLFVVALLLIAPPLEAEHGAALSEESYANGGDELGVAIFEVNWGRRWECGNYENAQLQRLTFTARSSQSGRFDGTELLLEAPSRLFVDNAFTATAIMINPGIYALTGFDVKTARSITDVGHYVGTEKELLVGGEPQAGSFTVAAGEIVYIGHFGLDCGDEVIPWRYYLSDREMFEDYVQGFRETFPFTNTIDVEFRLFETNTIGTPFSLDEPVVLGIR